MSVKALLCRCSVQLGLDLRWLHFNQQLRIHVYSQILLHAHFDFLAHTLRLQVPPIFLPCWFADFFHHQQVSWSCPRITTLTCDSVFLFGQGGCITFTGLMLTNVSCVSYGVIVERLIGHWLINREFSGTARLNYLCLGKRKIMRMTGEGSSSKNEKCTCVGHYCCCGTQPPINKQ